MTLGRAPRPSRGLARPRPARGEEEVPSWQPTSLQARRAPTHGALRGRRPSGRPRAQRGGRPAPDHHPRRPGRSHHHQGERLRGGRRRPRKRAEALCQAPLLAAAHRRGQRRPSRRRQPRVARCRGPGAHGQEHPQGRPAGHWRPAGCCPAGQAHHRPSDRRPGVRPAAGGLPGRRPTQAEQLPTSSSRSRSRWGRASPSKASPSPISQDGGTYSVTRDGAVVFNLEGTPTGLVLYNGSLVVPENRDGGWDVVSYMIADGSVPAYVMGAGGNAAGGSGDIQSATLDGSALKVTDSRAPPRAWRWASAESCSYHFRLFTCGTEEASGSGKLFSKKYWTRVPALAIYLLRKAHGVLAQLVRAPACHVGGRRFESLTSRQHRQSAPQKWESSFLCRRPSRCLSRCLHVTLVADRCLTVHKHMQSAAGPSARAAEKDALPRSAV